MKSAIETVLVEPNLLVREGLQRILGGTKFELCAHAATLAELEFAAPDRRIMVIIAPPENGTAGDDRVAQVPLARAQFPSAWIVFLSSMTDLSGCVQALRAGANAFLTKANSAEALVKSLELVTLGAVTIPASLLHDLLHPPERLAIPPIVRARDGQADPPCLIRPEPAPRGFALSNREMSILECIQRGDSNKLIARQYELAEATVKVHVKAILRKIGARNRTQAAIWAMSQSQSKLNGHAWQEAPAQLDGSAILS